MVEEMRTGGSRVAIGWGSIKCLWLGCIKQYNTDEFGKLRV